MLVWREPSHQMTSLITMIVIPDSWKKVHDSEKVVHCDWDGLDMN